MSASAANWVKVDTSTNATDYYLDSKSIKRNGNTVKAWVKGSKKIDDSIIPNSGGIQIYIEKDEISLIEISCKNETYRLLAVQKIYLSGKTVNYNYNDLSWKYITPDNTGTFYASCLCPNYIILTQFI